MLVQIEPQFNRRDTHIYAGFVEITMVQQGMPFPTVQNESVFYYINHHPIRHLVSKGAGNSKISSCHEK